MEINATEKPKTSYSSKKYCTIHWTLFPNSIVWTILDSRMKYLLKIFLQIQQNSIERATPVASNKISLQTRVEERESN